jgi:isopentenyl diphosphate isomerase/L-lactate dehydrogenase-like FMN-dependent dehydrogenase
MEIYVDGGARRGTDVLMALALGAKGVGFGRPFLFAQAAYGEKGTIRAVRSESAEQTDDRSRRNADDPVLENEIVTAMQLMGVSKLDQLRPEMIECLQELWK